jgi:hypothetical protein
MIKAMRTLRSLAVAVFILAQIPVGAVAADQGTMEHKRGFGDAITQPLDDFNVRRVEIPAVLARAAANPYDLKGLDHCETIAAEVGRLDEALGRDLDEAPPPDKRGKVQKVASAAHELAVDEAGSQVNHFIPLRDWIRKLSGAERHAKRVQSAIRAGMARRAYLKGLGMERNCAPPAAPSWFKPHPAAAAPAGHGFLGWWAGLWAGLLAWIHSWWPF